MECFTTAEFTTTNLWVCHRDCTDPWYITGVMVYYSAFTCLDTPFGPVLQWYLTIFGPIWKIISPLNSANFSTSDRMNEINFQNPILGGLEFTHLGLLISVGLRSQKEPLQTIRFPLVPLICMKTFPPSCAQDYQNSVVFFALALPMLEISDKFHNSRVHYQDIYGFATDSSEIRRI